MPWQELAPVNLRMRFVTEWQTGFWSTTGLCAEYGVSRKTGYKWLRRYLQAGPAGLQDQSRRPVSHPYTTEPAVVEALLECRRRHPTWGARKLLKVLRDQAPGIGWPARSTVCDLLKARGCVRARPRRYPRAKRGLPLVPTTGPNETWTTDFKGQFRTRDGQYCYPLTLRDGFSRFVLRCDALTTTRHDAVRPCFERAFAEYGLPERIRSDNGGPFASTGFAGLSRLSVWWLRLGIALERIEPGHPEQNGSHEQFHRVLKAETARPPAETLSGQQRRFTRFQAEYNSERPHEALGDEVPAAYYQRSSRPLPRHLPPVDYPGHWEVRAVCSQGTFSWGGRLMFLSEALGGQRVGLEEVDDGLWTIHFAGFPLGRLDEQQRRVYPIVGFSEGHAATCDPQKPQ